MRNMVIKYAEKTNAAAQTVIITVNKIRVALNFENCSNFSFFTGTKMRRGGYEKEKRKTLHSKLNTPY